MQTIYNDINNYYSDKIKEFGATARGVDWNGNESQAIRFEQLLKLIKQDGFSLADIGCGYGKLCEYMTNIYNDFYYHGYDLSEAMIKTAPQCYPATNHRVFTHIQKLKDIEKVDYSIASGIFNVKMNYSESEWLSYILKTIDVMAEKSNKGFAFNLLTKYSDADHIKSNLYYSDPCFTRLLPDG